MPPLHNIGENAESGGSSSNALARSHGRGSKARLGAAGGVAAVTTGAARSAGAGGARCGRGGGLVVARVVARVGGGLAGRRGATQILNVGLAELLVVGVTDVHGVASAKELEADVGRQAVGVVL